MRMAGPIVAVDAAARDGCNAIGGCCGALCGTPARLGSGYGVVPGSSLVLLHTVVS
jgi:hypothetical protein